ncbi:26S proteasome non-ATPase regulatory subunit 12 [Blattella germanica]|nr:26S proteasome non-ATPase regulatory subunit 12 [Blattella germanica]
MADNAATDSGRIVKMEVDYSSTCDEKIPECQKMAKEGKMHDALDTLLSLEKQTRTGADMISTGRVLVAIVQICFEARNWNLLNEHIALLAKRRSQLKQAVAKMVQECCTYVEQAPNKETKIKLIDTLRNVTEGKIYVEVERARLTHKLAKMKEEEGNIIEAANIIQELQVETYGSMEKREKASLLFSNCRLTFLEVLYVELILEQMRLCLAKRDYIRTQIISKKINTKFFEDEGTQDLKLKFYRLMIELDQHEGSYLATCKHYRAVLNTPSVQEDPKQRHQVLQNVVLYLVLAPYDNEQADLTHRVLEDKLMEEIPMYKELLRLFINPELIKWSGLCDIYEKELKGSATDVFNPTSEEGQKRWKDLRSRVVEHNIRVMAKYYTRITLKRMAELLDLPVEETEDFLSNLVVNKTVLAKTDRPAGVVSFAQSKDPNDVLNEWSNHLSSLMQLVNKTTHLINKEEMVHKHLLAVRE